MFQRIRDLREDRDLTQKQVATVLNCSQQVYSNYELGQRDLPTAVLLALADYYGVSTDYILGRKNAIECTKARWRFAFLYLPLTAVLGYGIKGIRSRVALTQLVANG